MSWLISLLRALPSALADNVSGVALITLLPFMFSGIVFEPFFPSALEALVNRAPAVFTPPFALLMVAICIATLVFSRNFRFAMCVLSALILAALSITYTYQSHELLAAYSLQELWKTLWILYTFTGFLTCIVIVREPTVSTMLFRGILFVLVVDLATWLIFGNALLSPFFIGYFPSHFSVVFVLMILMFIRTIVKFFQENTPAREQVAEFDEGYLKAVRKRTLKLWWPMPLLFLVFTGIYQYVGDRYLHRPLILYFDNYEAVINSGRLPDAPDLRDRCANPVVPQEAGEITLPCTVEAAAKDLTARLADRNIRSVRGGIDAQVNALGDNNEAIIAAVEDQMPRRFPGTEITETCYLLNVGTCIQNGIKSMINGAYRSARDGMIDDLERDLASVDKSATNSAEQMKQKYTDRMNAFAGRTEQAIGYTATGIRFAGFLALAYGLLILAKSYMIVFARVFFARVATSPAREAVGASERARRGQINVHGSQLTLNENGQGGRFYVAFRACGNNVVDRRRLPQPSHLMIKRLFSRNLAMCLVDFDAEESVPTSDIIVDPPAQITEWKLRDDDVVYLDFSNVIAFQDSCTLGRSISLSIGALIFGRAIYHSVSGPGSIFLRTDSDALTGSMKGADNVMQASSLVAWRQNTDFHVVASLTVSDTFFSGFSVRKADEKANTVVYDTSQGRRVGAGQGILRLTRAFLLPF